MISSSLAESIRKLGDAGPISVMPDYFVDRFVRIESIDDLFAAVRKKSAEGGGGSIRRVNQSEVKGGNAVNLAYALAKFGAEVNLFGIASGLPAETLLATFRNLPNVHIELIDGKAGFTIALEFFEHGRHANVMISDAGDLAAFDGTSISQHSWQLVSKSKMVCVLNWAANRKGNDLLERVFSFARRQRLLTFFDPADVTELADLLPDLRERVLKKNMVDFISINDNEARIICKTLFGFTLPQDYGEDDLKRAVRLLSNESKAIVDLHTRTMSVSCIARDCTLVHCHKVQQRTVTGAGDVWDAADITGHMLGWDAKTRLEFANASAGLYVSRETAEPPTVDEALGFLEGHVTYY